MKLFFLALALIFSVNLWAVEARHMGRWDVKLMWNGEEKIKRNVWDLDGNGTWDGGFMGADVGVWQIHGNQLTLTRDADPGEEVLVYKGILNGTLASGTMTYGKLSGRWSAIKR